jgi:hypothetical protein
LYSWRFCSKQSKHRSPEKDCDESTALLDPEAPVANPPEIPTDPRPLPRAAHNAP